MDFSKKNAEDGGLFQHTFEFLHVLAEFLVHPHAACHLVAGMEHGAVVTLAEVASDLCIGHVRVFVTQEHGRLPGLHDGLLAAFGLEVLELDTVVLAYCRIDVIEGELLLLEVDGTCHHTFGELEVDVAVVHHGVGHDGVDDAFEFTHAALHILGDVLEHFPGNVESVAAHLREEYVTAELRVGLLHLGHHAPFESGEHTFLNAFEEHRRTVAGDDDLAVVVLQLVEYLEEGHLRVGGGNLLYVIDDEHIDALVEVDEVVARVVYDGIGVLRLEHIGRHEEHAFLRVELAYAYTDGIDQMCLAHTAWSVEEEGVESAVSWSFGDAHGYTEREFVALALHEVLEGVTLVELRVEGWKVLPLNAVHLIGAVGLLLPRCRFCVHRCLGYAVLQTEVRAELADERIAENVQEMLLHIPRHVLVGHLKSQHVIFVADVLYGLKPCGEMLVWKLLVYDIQAVLPFRLCGNVHSRWGMLVFGDYKSIKKSCKSLSVALGFCFSSECVCILCWWEGGALL